MTRVYTDLRIQRFRLFKDIEVALSPVTIISGRNNTGKSALLEALFLHASGPRAGGTALLALNAVRNPTPITLPQGEGQTVWDSLFNNYQTTRPVSLTAHLDGNAVTVEFKPADGPTVTPGTVAGGVASTSGESYSQSLAVSVVTSDGTKEYLQTATQQTYTQPSAALPLNFQFGGVNLQLAPHANPLIIATIVAGRTRSTQQEIAQRYSDLRVLNRQSDFLNALRSVDGRINSLEVLAKDGQSSLNLNIADRLMPLSLFGEGMVTVADIMSIMYSRNASLVLIDEIENGIHYSVLRDVWWHIKRAAQATNVQVIATTHSRECMAAADEAFREDAPDMLTLLRLSRRPTEPESVVATPYSAREIESALELKLDIR